MEKKREPILSVRGLVQDFVMHGRTHHAVRGISFDIAEGEVFGLVGESGSGKSTTARAIMGINAVTAGEIFLGGVDIARRSGVKRTKKDLEKISGAKKSAQMVFQDPSSSLNPRMTVLESVTEGLIISGVRDKELIRARGYDMLERVGLSRAAADRYPSEFSGGQKQRIGIARAIIMNPKLLICDEPVSALDVSVQAQIINLLSELQKDMGLSVLFIAHDLSIVRYLCDRIGAMYLGRLVEISETEELFENPNHPYTRSLLSAIPIPNPVLERKKKTFVYKNEDFLNVEGEMKEISKGHFVLPFG